MKHTIKISNKQETYVHNKYYIKIKKMRKILFNKKSQGHIEMMLSFALFLGAVLFIFIYINPFARTAEHSDELNSVQDTIMNYITANVGRLSVVTFSTGSGCYDFDALDYADASAIYVEVEENSPSTNKQYTIYFGDSSVFADTNAPHKEGSSSCLGAVASSDYRLGVFSNQTIISSRKIKYIVQEVGAPLGYGDFKKSLGINSDFSINTTDLNRNPKPELSFSKNIPGTVEVESREFPVVAINDTGQANQLILNIKVW